MLTYSWPTPLFLVTARGIWEAGGNEPSSVNSAHRQSGAASDVFDYDACLRRVRQHDQRAAEALVAQLHDLVMRIVRGRVPRQLSEQDVAQEVFIKMFHKLHQYQGAVPFEHWVSRIAVNTTLNALRGRRLRLELRRADLSESEDEALNHVVSSDALEDPSRVAGSRELLAKLLDRLNPKERLAVELIDLEGRTSDEAAEISGIRAAALRARVARARRKLREHLDNLLADER